MAKKNGSAKDRDNGKLLVMKTLCNMKLRRISKGLQVMFKVRH